MAELADTDELFAVIRENLLDSRFEQAGHFESQRQAWIVSRQRVRARNTLPAAAHAQPAASVPARINNAGQRP